MVNLGIFQRLPVEIRIHIWEFAIASDALVTFRLDQLQQQYYEQACQPSITRVGRQIRLEALPRYYETSNFVLHTAEGPKADDALRWLRCNRDYLSLVKQMSFWIRYVPSGAIAVSLRRPRAGDGWIVDPQWAWITVKSRPASAEISAKFIQTTLSESLSGISSDTAAPDDYFNLVTRLRRLRMDDNAT